MSERDVGAVPGSPAGEVYDWYRRGLELLDSGHAAAAAQLLEHVAAAEPRARSVREAVARAHFDCGRYETAEQEFRDLVSGRPDDDYAHFGLGLSLARLGRFREAVRHLSAAVAMRPDRSAYSAALRQARATQRARGE